MSQPTEYTVFLDPSDMSVEYLHVDLEGMEQCGPMQVQRASEVEFDDGIETGLDPGAPDPFVPVQVREPAWVARLNDNREIARHKMRGEVLRMEREVIERMRRDGEPIPGVTV